MKKVIVTTRVVYHKTASVVVNVPQNLNEEDIQIWLWFNEDEYSSTLEKELEKQQYELGFGLGDGFDEADSDTETRFDVVESNNVIYGGHI